MDDFLTRLNKRLLKETSPQQQPRAGGQMVRPSRADLEAARLRAQEQRILGLKEKDLKLSIRLNQERLDAEQEGDLGIATDTRTGGKTSPRK